MSALWLVDLRDQGIVLDDQDIFYGNVTLVQNTAGNVVQSNLTRVYYKAAILALGQAWDANGNGYTTWDLKINGGNVYQYCRQTISIGSPFGDTYYLPTPIWLPQQATVAILADLAAGGGGNSVFSSRMIVGYFRQDPNLQRLKALPGMSAIPQGLFGNIQPFRPRG